METSRNDDFRIVGGHIALNLVNTVAPRDPHGGDGTEFLPAPAELLNWSLQVGLVDPAEAADVGAAWSADAGAARQALKTTVDVREATYTVLAAALDDRLGPPGDALEELTRAWVEATARSRLVGLDGGQDTGVARLRVGAAPARMIPDRLAVAAVELVQHVGIARLRSCPLDEGGCGWLFVDESRNGSRRWCSMDDCGAHAKSRRLTAKRRDARRQ